MSAVLVVPVNGPLRVVNTEPEGIEAILTEHAEGRYVDFGVKEGDDEIGRVAFLIMEGPAAINLRARVILAQLTGVHMVITGEAAFSGLTDEWVRQLLADYT